MGKKVRWFDAVQRILSPSEPDRDEKEDKQVLIETAQLIPTGILPSSSGCSRRK